MKTIVYDPRPGANATYWDMKPEDQRWIIETLERILIEYAERSISKDSKDAIFLQYLTDTDRDLGRSPKHNQNNSPISVIGGILANLKLGSTKNLTDKACAKIGIIFDALDRAQQAGFINAIRVESIDWQQMGQRLNKQSNFDRLFTE